MFLFCFFLRSFRFDAQLYLLDLFYFYFVHFFKYSLLWFSRLHSNMQWIPAGTFAADPHLMKNACDWECGCLFFFLFLLASLISQTKSNPMKIFHSILLEFNLWIFIYSVPKNFVNSTWHFCLILVLHI